MYLALFLTPWVLMYGLSTMAMNHHQSLRALYGGAPAFSMERELTYERSFDEDAAAGQIAREILIDLDLDGRFRVRGDVSRRLTIIRRDPVSPRRIIYLPKEQRLTVEVQQFRTSNMLAQLHIRRGFQSGYSLDDLSVAGIRRPHLHPLDEVRNQLIIEPGLGRHLEILVLERADKQALSRLTWHQGRTTLAAFEDSLAGIEIELRLELLLGRRPGAVAPI